MTRLLAALVAAIAAIAPGSAVAQSLLDQCVADTCKARLTAGELLTEVQHLVAAKRYDEARPMIAALRGAPAMTFEWRFLSGYVAEQTGDFARAAAMFRAILVDDPKQTRVRLELAKTLFAMGQTGAADHHFRLAQEDRDLPPDVARTIRAARNIIRSRRAWTLNFDFGVAPDSNINNATSADAVTVMFGNNPVPVTLDQNARARSGTGRTGSIDAGLRLPVADKLSVVADFNAFGSNYKGRTFDDYSYEAAFGPEFKLSDTTRLRMQAVGAERDFGGRIASRQWGLKTGLETDVGDASRLAFQLDARRTIARFDHHYDGWQTGLYATYERAVARTLVVSAGGFVRRDFLAAKAYSMTEAGAIVGFGGELPMGFNVGVSGTASRALFDAPLYVFSDSPRRDWRFNARATLGNRALRYFGFSPSISVSFGKIDSSLDYYANQRTRFRFALARYF